MKSLLDASRGVNSNNTADPATSKGQYGDAIHKLHFLAIVFGDRKLNGCEKSCAFFMCEFYNLKKGHSYPSFAELAKKTGYSLKMVQLAVNRLVALGYFAKESGGRSRANSYFPAFPPEEGRPPPAKKVGKPITLPQSEVGKPITIDQGNPLPQTRETHYPSFILDPPEHTAKVDIRGDASGASPDGAAPSVAVGGGSKSFDAFIAIFPGEAKAHMASAKREHDKLVDGDPTLVPVLQSQAEAYAAFVKAKRPKFVTFPEKWLREQGWLNDYTLSSSGAKVDGGARKKASKKASEGAGKAESKKAKSKDDDIPDPKVFWPKQRTSYAMLTHPVHGEVDVLHPLDLYMIGATCEMVNEAVWCRVKGTDEVLKIKRAEFPRRTVAEIVSDWAKGGATEAYEAELEQLRQLLGVTPKKMEVEVTAAREKYVAELSKNRKPQLAMASTDDFG